MNTEKIMKTPSDKQIYFAKQIADALYIDFPQSSKDFTALHIGNLFKTIFHNLIQNVCVIWI